MRLSRSFQKAVLLGLLFLWDQADGMDRGGQGLLSDLLQGELRRRAAAYHPREGEAYYHLVSTLVSQESDPDAAALWILAVEALPSEHQHLSFFKDLKRFLEKIPGQGFELLLNLEAAVPDPGNRMARVRRLLPHMEPHHTPQAIGVVLRALDLYVDDAFGGDEISALLKAADQIP